jgi:hypothetical protein
MLNNSLTRFVIVNKRWGQNLISRSTGSNMSKNFATFNFVKPFILVAEVTWGLSNLFLSVDVKKRRLKFVQALYVDPV